MAQSNNINKANIWCGITYPENMVEGWEDKAPELLQGIPFAYCVHDKDLAKDEERKAHVHWILYFCEIKKGTTTRKYATDVLNLLSAPGKQCAIPAEACLNLEYAWNYLIHDTETARKDGKYQYPRESRITGNTFDIERYKQLSTEQKQIMLRELCDFVHARKIMDIDTLYSHIQNDFTENYFQVFTANNALLDRLCRGVYNKRQRSIQPVEAPKCGICGSTKIAGSYETYSGRMWFCGDCQETAYVYISELENQAALEEET